MHHASTLLGFPSANLGCYSESYDDACALFLKTLTSCSIVYEQLDFFLPLAKADNLFSHSVWLGDKTANNVLVLISATHGVEGFVGAAIQTDVLQQFVNAHGATENLASQSTAILIIFALNPYGFFHCRRCDESGIDLNRNFVDFNQRLPTNTGYLALRDVLFSTQPDLLSSTLYELRKDWGHEVFDMALSGGQYDDPAGPFFGGYKPAHGRRVIEALITHYQLADRHLAVIDIHSGLGPYGYGELINDHPPESSGWQVAKQWYGANATSPVLGESSSVPKHGLLDFAWHGLMQKQGCFITLEFGTYSTERLFHTVLQDHRCWLLGNEADQQHSAESMKKHFYPADDSWREIVLMRARQIIQMALTGLSNDRV